MNRHVLYNAVHGELYNPMLKPEDVYNEIISDLVNINARSHYILRRVK